MSPDVFDREALVKHRLEQSRKTLKDARLLYNQDGTPASVVNRAYYAMFYAVLALLVKTDRSSSKHSGVIALFDKEFVKQNEFPPEMSKMLHRAFEMRQEGDYQDISSIDKKKAFEVLESAVKFIKAIEEKIKNNA